MKDSNKERGRGRAPKDPDIETRRIAVPLEKKDIEAIKSFLGTTGSVSQYILSALRKQMKCDNII